jgi:hypothetical protein
MVESPYRIVAAAMMKMIGFTDGGLAPPRSP